MINTAIMGYGVVGKGCAELLRMNNELIESRLGQKAAIAKILDLRDFPGDINEDKITHDFAEILSDDSISIVMETMGGRGAAYKFTKALLEVGKSVVTSNKELVAYHGDELLEIAAEHGCHYMFEASTGGGIPIITPLADSLCANEIVEIRGIVNGTCNYILTAMNDGRDFSSALAEAQQKGYAETDPTADVEGYDACRKICILGAMAFGVLVSPDNVRTTGISGVSAEDVAAAKAKGGAVKLIARAVRGENGSVELSVAPELVGRDDVLYGVWGVNNGIAVRGNAVGEVFFYGPGAGSLPTASAVVGDVMRIAAGIGGYGSRGKWIRA